MTAATQDDLANLFFEVGDTTPDVCFHCEAEVTATFALRTVKLEQSSVDVDDVLVAVCPTCDRITSIPAQSEPRLREARERAADERMESRVTHAADDAFRAIASELSAHESVLRSRLVTYYLRKLQREPALVELVVQYSRGTLARGPRSARFAARVRDEDLSPVQAALTQRFGATYSDLTIGIIGLAASDILVHRTNARAEELRVIAGAL